MIFKFFRFIFFILFFLVNCSIFQKKFQSENKEIFQYIKVNLGALEEINEIKSNGTILLKVSPDEKKFSNSLRFKLSEIKGIEKFIFESNQFEIKSGIFRGELEIKFDLKQNKFLFINKVPLEDYLYGVVPSEMPASWNLEALKTQAIAARTYAVAYIQKNIAEIYHVESTVQSQVYGGVKKETKNSNLAVDQTKSEILVFAEKPIQAFYHSNSGGKTELAENVWGFQLPYLKSVESIYCEKAPNFNWEFKIGKSELSEKLGLKDILEISILDSFTSGRAKTIHIKETEDSFKNILAVDLRKLIGGVKIKSTLFDLKLQDEFVYFTGKGFGHGVGMSQWGAKGMADSGKTHKAILSLYYPGTEFARID